MDAERPVGTGRFILGLALALSGCPADPPYRTHDDGGRDGSGATISVHGRVVDFDSCAVPPGCQAASGMIVGVWGSSARSNETGGDGGFAIEGAPAGSTLSLVASSGTGDTGRHARTLVPDVVPASTEDVFGVLVYAIGRGPESLLAATRASTSVDLESDGGYIGLALTSAGDRFCPEYDEGQCAVSGVRVSVEPPEYGSVHYVYVLPVLRTGEPAFSETTTATTNMGSFVVVPAMPATQDLMVRTEHVDPALDIPDLRIHVEPGAVTLGYHRAD